MQNAYGHGGTRLTHILVCAVHELRPPIPLWQHLFLALLLLLVLAFFGRFDTPRPPGPKKTLIDISRLDVKSPPLPLASIEADPSEGRKPLRERSETVFAQPAPANPPPTEGKTKAEQGAARPKAAPVRHEVSPAPEFPLPVISRSSGYAGVEEAHAALHPVRERRGVEGEGMAGGGTVSLAGERARSEADAGADAAPGAAVPRARRGGSWHALQLQTASERIAVPRRTSPVVEVSADAPALPAAARSAPLPLQEREERAVVRARSKNPGAGEGAQSGIAVSRGVSLMSLKICDSSLQQEEAIKAVLSVVGQRQSCSSEKGAFLFKGTRRVSSFNLIIYPARGREPSHRCEELAYAYQCLKKN